MLDSWFNVLSLASESQAVVGLRLLKLGAGGIDARDEACLMVTEKVEAAFDAIGAMMAGRSPDGIVSDIRREVQANARRLAPNS